MIPKDINSIDYFRTKEYRVFYAPSYFNIDLKFEIRWHKKYIKELEKHKRNPLLFHKGRKYIEEQHIRYHKEWVIDSIPFHKKFITEHTKRLETILQLIPKRIYRKLIQISLKHKGTPEYFIYHIKTKTFFFVALNSDHFRNYWIHLVRDYHRICDVVILNNPDK